MLNILKLRLREEYAAHAILSRAWTDVPCGRSLLEGEPGRVYSDSDVSFVCHGAVENTELPRSSG